MKFTTGHKVHRKTPDAAARWCGGKPGPENVCVSDLAKLVIKSELGDMNMQI